MTQKTAGRQVERADRDRKIVSLRLKGWTYDQIAGAVGMTPGACYKRVAKRLADLGKQSRELPTELRDLEGERLDRLQAGLWSAATGGDLQAVATVLKIMERRSRLFNLDVAKEDGAALGHGGLVERVIIQVHPAPPPELPDPDTTAPELDHSSD